MRTIVTVALVLGTSAGGQQPTVVALAAEPSHHHVMTTERVRVFDVRVAPHATTLIHRHDADYLFVALGASDITSVPVGDTAVHLVLADGDVRYAKGGFAHAAANNSSRVFHNETIELVQPATHVVRCASACGDTVMTADQWVVRRVTIPASGHLTVARPTLAVAVSDVRLSLGTSSMRGAPGTLAWISAQPRPPKPTADLATPSVALIDRATNVAPTDARVVLIVFR